MLRQVSCQCRAGSFLVKRVRYQPQEADEGPMHLDTRMPVVASVEGRVQLPRSRAVIRTSHGVPQVVGVFLLYGLENNVRVYRCDAFQVVRIGGDNAQVRSPFC